MINVATVGVDIHKANMPKPIVSPSRLINKAAPTARAIRRTVKMAALFVSVSFVNIPQTLHPEEEAGLFT
jgi:aminoglycoside/choline kinase family phosphotransferase